MYINDAILHFLILEHLCSNIGTWNMDQEATRARLRSRTLNIGPTSAPLFSSRIKETLIGQKSIKVGPLELKLRMRLSISPFMLG